MAEYHFKESEETWNAIAESFDATRGQPWKVVVDFVSTLSASDVVADIGCGNGRHLILCVDKCNTVIGLDISKSLLKITKNKIGGRKVRVVFIHGNLVNIPIRGSSLDSVLYIAALHNIKGKINRIQSLNEVKRILKNDGRSLISVWSREQERFRDCFDDISDNDCEPGDIVIYWRQNKLNVPRFYHLYSKEEFIEDIKQSGLEIEQFSEAKIQSERYTDNYFAIVRKG
jgi:ubiquinone/menaquinone biosynthesis C-methylase UbiE